jgi:hypothetical protein
MKFLIVSFFIGIISCNSTPDNIIKSKTTVPNKGTSGSADSLVQFQFKSWMRDTLKNLQDFDRNNDGKFGLGVKKISVNPDSIGLTIITHYNINYDSLKLFKEKDVTSLIDLLIEYGEYPKGQFMLKFSTNYFYAPTPVQKIAYDLTFKIDSITILEDQNKVISKFEYIRGRLSNKLVTRRTENGTTKTERTNFVWEGSRLIKKKVS